MSINQLINELKENNEDFEFYPTTKEMIRTIYRNSEGGEWLNIGCGTCNFRKYFNELSQEQEHIYEEKEKAFRNSYTDDKGYNYDLQPKESDKPKRIYKYFVIEKSKILLDKLEKDVICLGTDFNSTFLLDKPVENIFCNPPYSEYENWACRIIFESNCKNIFLIIPERWKDNENIQKAIEESNSEATILGSFDFLNAERPARAKVDVIKIYRKNERRYYRDLGAYNETAFDRWFDAEFKMRDIKNLNEWEADRAKKEIAKNELVKADGSKAKILVDLYNNEIETLYKHFKAISSLDVEILGTIGIKKEAVKEALKKQATGAKTRYWRLAIDELEEVTDRLTSKTREDMFNRFKELQTVDFTLENIYPFILWVLKNANTYYNDQLIDFFKKLSSPENVKPYKSNQKAFEEENWGGNRHFKNRDKISHYTLDYRIIMSSPFDISYRGQLEKGYRTEQKLQDIFTIAKNLGFKIGLCDIPKAFGEKCTVLYEGSDKVFMEYRAYKNGNMHVKFDIEFSKAMNVEVSRLLGWIRSKEDIKKEFPKDMAQGAEKYFKSNYTCLTNNSLKLLTVQTKPQFEHISNTEELVILIDSNYKNCLETILSNIDALNNANQDQDTINKCLNILEAQKGFIYRNCLITKQDDKTKIEFREMKDFEEFSKLLERAA